MNERKPFTVSSRQGWLMNMEMSLMHIKSIAYIGHRWYQGHLKDAVCQRRSVKLPIRQVHGTLCKTKQSRVTIPHRLHDRALKDKV